MAITKIISAIHPPSKGKRHKILRNTIDYILDEEKTEGGRWIGSIACFPDTALQQMLATQHQYGQDKTNFGTHERLGYHLTISFSPEEVVPPELALQVMKEFSEEFVGNKFEAVYSVHTDKEHIHGHLCFNSVNYQTGRKFSYKDGDWAKIIQPITDRICQKYGLHTLEMDTGKSIEEYEKEEKEQKRRRYLKRMKAKEKQELKKHGYHKDGKEIYSWNDHLRLLLDDMVLQCSSMEELLKVLKERGVSIKQGLSKKYGEYLGLKAPGMEISRRTYQLGQEYTLENLKRRMEMTGKPLPEYSIPENMILVVPVRVYSRVKIKTALSKEMRRYYAKLYRLGIKPRSSRLTYQDVKAARARAAQVQRELELVIEKQIGSRESALKLISDCSNRLREKEEELELWKEKHKPYDMVIKNYRWYQKIKREPHNDLLISGKENEVLETARSSFEKYGFSEAEVEKYLMERKEEKKVLLQQIKDARLELTAAENILKDLEVQEVEKELTDEEQRFWTSVVTQEEVERKQKEVRI